MTIAQVLESASASCYSTFTSHIMADKKSNIATSEQVIALLLALPWLDILAEAYKLLRSLWRGLADEGMYEVLEHESIITNNAVFSQFETILATFYDTLNKEQSRDLLLSAYT